MNLRVGKSGFLSRALELSLLILFLASIPLWAQDSGPMLSGAIKGTSGAAITGARVTVKNLATGQTFETQTNAAGVYSVSNVAAGDYEVSVSAAGFGSQQTKVTIKGASQTADLTLSAALSLQDLGFGAGQTKGSAAEQARLNKRSHMLHVHQELGLITTAPLVATVLTGFMAGGKSTSSSTRDFHAALGSATAGLYAATAYYAIFAPKIPGTKTEGSIRLHKALVWIHGPGMVLTPILGAMAFNQKSQGERVHGIASAHGEVAIVTAVAYGLAIWSVWRPSSFSRSTHDVASLFHWRHSTPADAYSDGYASGGSQ
ncbi:MAG: carboxypeptidase-like regulatory domain-containing protein [Terriglobales bacterium]